jgi:O-succinylbenzoic acid--CoA ligase
LVSESWLERAAALHPERTAVEAPDGARTYRELLDAALAVAGALAARGVRRGDRVAIALPAGTAFAEALHGCLLAGAAAMPVDPRLATPEQAARLRTAATTIDGPLEPAPPAPVPAALDLDDPALVVHTSGTTGAPRAVTLSLGNVQASAQGSAIALGLGRDERWLCPLPLSHVGGLMVLLRSAIYATTAVLGPPDTPGVTLASLVPTQLARLLDAGTAPPPGLRAVVLGGAPAPRALLERARDAGWPVAPTYGLTQAGSQVTVGEIGDVETSGRALPGVRVTLAPDGEILVEGPTVAGGGTLRTGDLGTLDDRGRLRVTGRKTDTIVTGGENVAPAEVEAVLLAHPAVADAGVFARPHPEWGEAVTARVVLRRPATPDELRAWAHERLARFKVPKEIELADGLPRTASGKLLRRELA